MNRFITKVVLLPTLIGVLVACASTPPSPTVTVHNPDPTPTFIATDTANPEPTLDLDQPEPNLTLSPPPALATSTKAADAEGWEILAAAMPEAKEDFDDGTVQLWLDPEASISFGGRKIILSDHATPNFMREFYASLAKSPILGAILGTNADAVKESLIKRNGVLPNDFKCPIRFYDKEGIKAFQIKYPGFDVPQGPYAKFKSLARAVDLKQPITIKVFYNRDAPQEIIDSAVWGTTTGDPQSAGFTCGVNPETGGLIIYLVESVPRGASQEPNAMLVGLNEETIFLLKYFSLISNKDADDIGNASGALFTQTLNSNSFNSLLTKPKSYFQYATPTE